MTREEKALENLRFIRELLDSCKMNPSFEELDLIYKKTRIEEEYHENNKY